AAPSSTGAASRRATRHADVSRHSPHRRTMAGAVYWTGGASRPGKRRRDERGGFRSRKHASTIRNRPIGTSEPSHHRAPPTARARLHGEIADAMLGAASSRCRARPPTGLRTMLRDAVTLDAAMTVGQALRRLARHGYWLDPEAVESRAWLDEYAARIRAVAAVPRLVLAGDEMDFERPRDRPGEESWPHVDATAMTSGDAARLLARSLDEGRVAIRRQDGVTIFWYARRVDEVLHRLADQP